MLEAPRRLETREMLIKSQSQILQEFIYSFAITLLT